jgi:hypothetical protein
MTPKLLCRRRGLTALELLLVISVVLLIAGLLPVALGPLREKAGRAASKNKLGQLGLALHAFAEKHNSRLPPGAGDFGNKTGTLHFFLLPHLQQEPLFNRGTNAVWDNDVWSTPLSAFVDERDPSAPRGNVFEGWQSPLATTNFAANGMLFAAKPKYKIGNIPDGTSNTLFLAERSQMCNGTPTAWGYPRWETWAPVFARESEDLPQFAFAPNECNPNRAQAINGVVLVALCDGSVRVITAAIDAKVWADACIPDKGLGKNEGWD